VRSIEEKSSSRKPVMIHTPNTPLACAAVVGAQRTVCRTARACGDPFSVALLWIAAVNHIVWLTLQQESRVSLFLVFFFLSF
jgi:hypothetical protein